MVRSVKRCLKNMTGRARLSLDELHTALVEVESIVNSRPLTYVAASDWEEPITPSHLLIGRRVLNLPDALSHSSLDPGDEEFTLNASQLEKRRKLLNDSVNLFWKRWRTEYLTELRDSHRKLYHGRAGSPSIAIGDVVIVHDESLPRGFWKLGVIEEVISGMDGQVRGATVRLHSSDKRLIRLNRPIQLLYPLEARCDQEVVESVPVTESRPTSEPSSVTDPAMTPETAESHPRPQPGGPIKDEESGSRSCWMTSCTRINIEP